MKGNVRDTDLINTLYEISTLATRKYDTTEATNAVLEIITRYFSADAAYVALVNPDTGMLEIETMAGLWKNEGIPAPNLKNGIAHWEGLQGKPMAIPDFTKTSRFLPSALAIESEMAAPLMEMDSVVGVIHLSWSKTDPGAVENIENLARLTLEAGRVLGGLWLIERLKNKARQLARIFHEG